jgi:hypothetical protein
MEGSTVVLLEGLLVFGGVLAFGIWQLASLRRASREAEERKRK